MISSWVLLLVSIVYVALLFLLAWWGDRRPRYFEQPRPRALIYSLALAVYCSAWTFYGAVGSAVRHGIDYLPAYIGPVLLMLFGWRVIERLALIAQDQNTASISDFISARYGRSRRLAALVTLIALVGVMPYIALQYKAVAVSVRVLSGQGPGSGIFSDPALYVALLMALFAMLFGTRRVDATRHHHGMMLAIAAESLVKLAAMLAIGLFAYLWLNRHSVNVIESSRQLFENPMPTSMIAQTILAGMAILCLPRQFQVAVVECADVGDIRKARWLFSGYLLLIVALVVPITLACTHVFGSNNSPSSDALILVFPLLENQSALALAVYLGGLSAATSMVIVTSIALATMVSNNLVMPLLLRNGWKKRHADADMASLLLWVRRAVILILAVCTYGYYRGIGGGRGTLSSYGTIALVAVAQFAPALVGGLYWRGGSRRGVELGLLAGFAIWAYTLLLPALSASGWFDSRWLSTGPFGIEWLRPGQLFGLHGWDLTTHGMFWSLLINSSVMMLVSARWRLSVSERLRIAPFLDPYAERRKTTTDEWTGNVSIEELKTLTKRIVGERYAERAFAEYAALLGHELHPSTAANRHWVQFTERLLAASIGTASARLILTSVLRGSGMDLSEIVAMLDEAGKKLRFNREILSTTLENISAGVSVIDSQMRLVAWNNRYQEMFDYPKDMLYVGCPVADLIRYNAERGELGEGNIDEQIRRRVGYMRAGSPHLFERVRNDGTVIEMRGQALPGGGYVTSYNDVTEFKRVERALLETNETLEHRVAERTREAEEAQQSRTRFLAAISHDVLQPLNAARLFASALRDSNSIDEQRHLAERVDASLRAAEELLDGLLDVSRLDTGTLQAEIHGFDAGELLRELAAQYVPIAASRRLELRVHAQHCIVRSDRRLLRRVLQNFLANALRYTRQGGIVLGMRRRGDMVSLQVWDTGPGIPEQHIRQIYDEFQRYQQPFDWGERGMGLGLSICQRISRLLNHTLDARSKVGRGSMFAIDVPIVTDSEIVPERKPAPAPADSLAGLRVLCVDNDQEILDGMRILLGRWDVETVLANTVDQALEKVRDERLDVMLVDFHLHDHMDGLNTLDALRAAAPRALPGALLTADGRDELKREARAHGYLLLTKPVKPASLRAFLAAHHTPSA